MKKYFNFILFFASLTLIDFIYMNLVNMKFSTKYLFLYNV